MLIVTEIKSEKSHDKLAKYERTSELTLSYRVPSCLLIGFE
jgi:hypothetical protein